MYKINTLAPIQKTVTLVTLKYKRIYSFYYSIPIALTSLPHFERSGGFRESFELPRLPVTKVTGAEQMIIVIS